MKLTLFGDINRKSLNERLQKEMLDVLEVKGLLPVLTELVKETKQKGEAMKKELLAEGFDESEAQEIIKETEEEVLNKIISSIDRYVKSLPEQVSMENLPSVSPKK